MLTSYKEKHFRVWIFDISDRAVSLGGTAIDIKIGGPFRFEGPYKAYAWKRTKLAFTFYIGKYRKEDKDKLTPEPEILEFLYNGFFLFVRHEKRIEGWNGFSVALYLV